MSEQSCVRCGAILTDENWNPSRKKRNLHYCKSCDNDYSAKWSQEHPEERNLITRAYAQRHPEKQTHRNSEEQKAYYEAHKEEMRASQKKYDQTPAGKLSMSDRGKRWRDSHPEAVKAYMESHREERAMQAIRRLWALKIQAFEMLGGKCVGCGNTDPRVLQVNHKKGFGTKESRFGQDMYRGIIEGFRKHDDLDLRCANCNILYEYEVGKRRMPSVLKNPSPPFPPDAARPSQADG